MVAETFVAQPLRVLHIVLSLAPGGTERLVIELIRRTRPLCHSIVCCLDDEGAWAPTLSRDGTAVIALHRRPGFRPGLGGRIARISREHRADVLHCHHYSSFVYGAASSLLTHTPIVFTEHGRLAGQRPSWKRRLVNPALGRQAAAIFAVSDAVRDFMLTEGLPPARVRVLLNGIDPGDEPSPDARRAARRSLDLPDDSFVIGTAARLDPVKDIATLLDAFAHVKREREDARLVVIGDGPERAALEERSARLGISAHALFTGYRDDARCLLPALDAFANSSTSEGISLTILEAMAACLPVAATAVGGTPDVVVDGQTGILVPAGDAVRLAQALSTLAGSRGHAAELGKRGRRRVLERFTIDRMVAAYLGQYQAAAARRP